MNYQHSIIGELVADAMGSPLFNEKARIPVQDMAMNSKDIKKGWLFVALKGGQGHGMDYLQTAQKAGACAALVDEKDMERAPRLSMPLIPVRDLATNLTRIADRLYGGKQLEWSAVTGTNGKSSVAHLLAQSLSTCGIKTAAVGTVYQGFSDEGKGGDFLTTPDPITLRRLRANFCNSGAQHLIVEASSHALTQNRLRDLKLTSGILTNVKEDHRDYHKSKEDYVAAKRCLFDFSSLENGIFNLDDAWGKRWFGELNRRINCLSYSIDDPQADIYAEKTDLSIKGIKASFKVLGRTVQFCSSLIGRWQMANVLASLALLLVKQISLNDAVTALSKARGLRGRMQSFTTTNGTHFYVDYAHTTDALRQVLSELRRLCLGNLWVVFGCGGDRDKEKRYAMGKVAGIYADRIVLTNDNPRHENPLTIIEAIRRGIPKNKDVQIEMDRGKAFDLVITETQPEDFVLVAGKGHEDYQEIAGTKYPFNDYAYLVERLC